MKPHKITVCRVGMVKGHLVHSLLFLSDFVTRDSRTPHTRTKNWEKMSTEFRTQKNKITKFY